MMDVGQADPAVNESIISSKIRRYVQETVASLTELHEAQLARLRADSALAEQRRQEERAEADRLLSTIRQKADQRQASIVSLLEAAKFGANALTEARQKSALLASELTALNAERDGAERQLEALELKLLADLKEIETALQAARLRRLKLQSQVDQLESDQAAAEASDADRQFELDRRLADLQSVRDRVASLESRIARCEGPAVKEARTTAASLEAYKAELLLTLKALKNRSSNRNGDVEAMIELDVNFREFVAAKRELTALREENDSLRSRAASAAASAVSLRRLKRDRD